MTRVSENSSSASLNFALNKTKAKMEDLQIKGSTLKAISKPSDNPISNVEAMSLNSLTNDNIQYLKNADYALLNLSVTEKSIEELTELITKAKEISIAQASDFFNPEVRKNVSNEVEQLYNQALAISNKKIGIKNIFSGTNTLTVPFDAEGNYKGNNGHINLEISRDFFVPINLTGDEIFYSTSKSNLENPLLQFKQFEKNHEKENETSPEINREVASNEKNNEEADSFKNRDNIFSQLRVLTTALNNDDPKMIQDLLESFDSTISRLVTLRTRIGSITNSVEISQKTMEGENVDHASRRSSLLDADVSELFSDINKQQAILKMTYQSSQGNMNQTLMDFLRK